MRGGLSVALIAWLGMGDKTMGWSIGYDSNWKRDIGYGVPAICDHPGCDKEIDRGLSYVCGGEPYGGEHGCGLYFCGEHMHYHTFEDGETQQACERCCTEELQPFEPKPDVLRWVEWKLKHESWQQWRDENPDEVEKLKQMAA